jgi:hypothetical protein
MPKLDIVKLKGTVFEHTKKEVVIAFDACSIDTLRRFYNRSSRFMDAYRRGSGVRAAAWCVEKQKRRRTISEEGYWVEDRVSEYIHQLGCRVLLSFSFAG